MQLESVLVIGAGTMGSSIAQWFSQQGVQVDLTDKNDEAIQKAEVSIVSSFDKLLGKGKFSQDEITTFKKLMSFIPFDNKKKTYDLVVEAIIENKDIKSRLFKDLDKHCEDKTIFASNTSSIPITSLTHGLSEKRKSKLLGLHFFNPATIMKLVEIIGHDDSDPKLIQDLYSWFDKNNKRPAICSDSPGFIVNRVARNYYGEALRIAGVAGKTEDFKEIDQVMREVGGFKMGPFELLDLIGVDVNLSVTESVWNSFYHEPRFAPHRLQKNMVESGRHGRKSGRGFYEYK